jgi:phosphate transport system ATP-binding protein
VERGVFLLLFNRLAEEAPYRLHVQGQLLMDGLDLHTSGAPSLANLRAQVAWHRAEAVVFPGSVLANLLLVFRLRPDLTPEAKAQREALELVLHLTDLYTEIPKPDRTLLSELSEGQLRRLVLARMLLTGPSVLLFDQPTRGLDPVSASQIETLLIRLKTRCTIVFTTDSIQQAGRVSDNVVFMAQRQVVEAGPTRKLLTNPSQAQTQNFITRRY